MFLRFGKPSNYFNKKYIVSKKVVLLQRKMFRDVAQPGSALRSGRRGRKFESCHPDTKKSADGCRLIFLLLNARSAF